MGVGKGFTKGVTFEHVLKEWVKVNKQHFNDKGHSKQRQQYMVW